MKSLVLALTLVASFACAQAPPAPSGPTKDTPPVPTPQAPKQAGHQADLAYSNPSCTTASSCTLQIYRAQCDNPTTCPNYIYSPQSFKTLSMTGLQSNITSTGTSWAYSDTDPNLLDNTSYSWVSINTYVSNPTMASGPSTPFLGTIPALPTQVAPANPTTGACRIVK